MMWRRIFAVVAGVIGGGIFNMLLVNASHILFPLPADVDPNDLESLKAYVTENGLPTGALVMILLAHSGGSFFSGFIGGLIVRRTWILAAIGFGILWTCGGIAMLMVLPAPIWFAVADTLLYIPAALLGMRLGGTIAKPPP